MLKTTWVFVFTDIKGIGWREAVIMKLGLISLNNGSNQRKQMHIQKVENILQANG